LGMAFAKIRRIDVEKCPNIWKQAFFDGTVQLNKNALKKDKLPETISPLAADDVATKKCKIQLAENIISVLEEEIDALII